MGVCTVTHRTSFGDESNNYGSHFLEEKNINDCIQIFRGGSRQTLSYFPKESRYS